MQVHYTTILLSIAKTASSQNESAFNDEINAYDKLKWNSKCKLSSVEFWMSKSQELPSLSCIALEIMTVPATEVSVERLFSHLKIVFTENFELDSYPDKNIFTKW